MITEHSRLSERDLGAVAELERRVVDADGGRLKLEWRTLRHRSGERTEDLLWREDGRLLAFLGLYHFGGQLELAGMVDPDARRRGIGTALVGRALELAAGRNLAHVLLVVARTTPAGDAFARSLGGVLEHSEHSLLLRAAPTTGRPRLAGVQVRPAQPDDERAVAAIFTAAFGEGAPPADQTPADPTPADQTPAAPSPADQTPADQTPAAPSPAAPSPADQTPPAAAASGPPAARHLVIEHAGAIAGTLRVEVEAPAAGVVAGIYGFAVDPTQQGRGIGREALRQVCAGLYDEGCSEVTLEVAVDNEHALGLYTSLGFERRATEDYYQLDTAASRHRAWARGAPLRRELSDPASPGGLRPSRAVFCVPMRISAFNWVATARPRPIGRRRSGGALLDQADRCSGPFEPTGRQWLMSGTPTP